MAKKKQTVKVYVVQKEVFGSLIGNAFSEDTLVDVRDWIDKILGEIPEVYRKDARIRVDSVGGYEGEHHVEFGVHYNRIETDEEQAERESDEKARREYQEERERTMLAKLQAKYHK